MGDKASFRFYRSNATSTVSAVYPDTPANAIFPLVKMMLAKSLVTKIQFIEPRYALAVRNLPGGPDWLYGILMLLKEGNDLKERYCSVSCISAWRSLWIGAFVALAMVYFHAERLFCLMPARSIEYCIRADGGTDHHQTIIK